jgi:hypothetical protein
VEQVLRDAGLGWVDAADRDGPYTTASRLLTVTEIEIDLMVQLAICPAGDLHNHPPVRTHSLPDKSDLIHDHLAVTGTNPDHLARMLAEPLPEDIRKELEELRHG